MQPFEVNKCDVVIAENYVTKFIRFHNLTVLRKFVEHVFVKLKLILLDIS